MTQEENDTFRPWLEKKGLNYASFSLATGVKYFTVAELGSGDNWFPRERIASMIRRVFPGCPLLKRKPKVIGRGGGVR
jgi:hypothetical protein